MLEIIERMFLTLKWSLFVDPVDEKRRAVIIAMHDYNLVIKIIQ